MLISTRRIRKLNPGEILKKNKLWKRVRKNFIVIVICQIKSVTEKEKLTKTKIK